MTGTLFTIIARFNPQRLFSISQTQKWLAGKRFNSSEDVKIETNPYSSKLHTVQTASKRMYEECCKKVIILDGVYVKEAMQKLLHKLWCDK